MDAMRRWPAALLAFATLTACGDGDGDPVNRDTAEFVCHQKYQEYYGVDERLNMGQPKHDKDGWYFEAQVWPSGAEGWTFGKVCLAKGTNGHPFAELSAGA